jgi:hypothetical protein
VRMGPIRCPETSVKNYHTTPEDRRFNQHRDGSLKSKNKNTFEKFCYYLWYPYITAGSGDTVVGIAVCFGLDGPGFEPRWGVRGIYLLHNRPDGAPGLLPGG